jgi:hypothetical protein
MQNDIQLLAMVKATPIAWRTANHNILDSVRP